MLPLTLACQQGGQADVATAHNTLDVNREDRYMFPLTYSHHRRTQHEVDITQTCMLKETDSGGCGLAYVIAASPQQRLSQGHLPCTVGHLLKHRLLLMHSLRPTANIFLSDL